MKKIINLFIVLLGILVFAACSDNIDNPYGKESTISVVKSNLVFPARAANGVVEFHSQGTVSASSNATWCKTSVVGDTVKVAVDQNNNRDGRSTVVTLHNGTDSVNIPLVQGGLVFQLSVSSVINSSDLAASFTYAMSANLDFNVLSAPDWVTVSNTEDSLKISMSANTTGHLRSDYVKYNVGSYKDSIKVVQGDFDTDLAGDYYLVSKDGDGQIQAFNAVVSKDTISLPDLDLKIPITFDGASISISTKCGEYIGTFNVAGTIYYVYTAFADATFDYWTAYNIGGAAYTAAFDYDINNGTYAEFSGTFGTHEIGTLLFAGCISKQFNANSLKTFLLEQHSPYLLKKSDSPAKIANLAKKNQLKFVLR